MAGSIAVILAVGFIRDFYAVQLPPADVLLEASGVAVVAIILLEVAFRLSRVVGNRRDPAREV